MNPLDKAASTGDPDKVALLLAHGATIHNTRALLNAADEGHVATMQLLLDHGVDIDAHPYDKYTLPMYLGADGWGSALHCAVGNNQVESVKFLLEKGAATNLKNRKGLTPRDLAVKRGYPELVQLLEQDHDANA